MMPEYVDARTKEEYAAAGMLFREYAAHINVDLDFQHFEDELRSLDEMYSLPQGGIFLCKENDEYIGCVAIRRINEQTAELKRMFVRPTHHGKGIGKELLQKAIGLARACQYKMIRLDTLDRMHSAISLYKRFGFYEIPAYYFNPNATAVYFEMKL